MADHLQFEAFPSSRPECRRCEELLADAVDDLVSQARLAQDDRTFFDGHIATCADCLAALADARRGAAWLEMLKTPRPEPSARLLERILSQTSGAPGNSIQAVPAGPPSYPPRVLPFRPRLPQPIPRFNGLNRLLFEPRLALTAAMAFFSIALTLNLAGVRLNQLHADDLGPSGIRRTYYQATASVARRYEGLRVVHTLESRVDDLRQANQDGDGSGGLPHPADHPHLPATLAPASPAPVAPEPNHSQPREGGVSRRAAPQAQPRLLPVLDRKQLTAAPLTPLTHKEGGLA